MQWLLATKQTTHHRSIAMAAYFAGTINALKSGITRMSASAAIRNIENWEDSLQDVEISGCRAILRDLGALKKLLEEDQPDGERIRHLMARLGSQTVAISEKSDARYADKVANLGEMLADAAESADDEDEHTDRRTKSSSGRSSGHDVERDEDGRFTHSSESGRSGQGNRRHDDGDRDHSRSSARMSGSSQDDDHEDEGRASKGQTAGRSSASGRGSESADGRGEVRDPRTDGRLKENRDRNGKSDNRSTARSR
jgi:hypothetical protein